jgi:hypothetical protein
LVLEWITLIVLKIFAGYVGDQVNGEGTKELDQEWEMIERVEKNP